VPTSKFGDARRRASGGTANFFETGLPHRPKNADAIRKVLEELALDDDDDDEEMDEAGPILTTLEVTPKKEKKQKRKSDAMDIDERRRRGVNEEGEAFQGGEKA